jgi:hypothetical protein
VAVQEAAAVLTARHPLQEVLRAVPIVVEAVQDLPAAEAIHPVLPVVVAGHHPAVAVAPAAAVVVVHPVAAAVAEDNHIKNRIKKS